MYMESIILFRSGTSKNYLLYIIYYLIEFTKFRGLSIIRMKWKTRIFIVFIYISKHLSSYIHKVKVLLQSEVIKSTTTPMD